MEDNNIIKTSYSEDIQVKDLKLDNSDYIVFCYDKKDFYHMVTIIDKVIYDKNTDYMDLYVITIYKKITASRSVPAFLCLTPNWQW